MFERHQSTLNSVGGLWTYIHIDDSNAVVQYRLSAEGNIEIQRMANASSNKCNK